MMDLLNCRLLSFAVELDSLVVSSVFWDIRKFGVQNSMFWVSEAS